MDVLTEFLLCLNFATKLDLADCDFLLNIFVEDGTGMKGIAGQISVFTDCNVPQ
jgi:hypothetical protein